MSNARTSNEASHLHELLVLYSEFTELDACYAFFCDAVATLSDNQDALLDNTSAEGLRILSQWLKDRSAGFKDDLNVVWRAASAHQRQTCWRMAIK